MTEEPAELSDLIEDWGLKAKTSPKPPHYYVDRLRELIGWQVTRGVEVVAFYDTETEEYNYRLRIDFVEDEKRG